MREKGKNGFYPLLSKGKTAGAKEQGLSCPCLAKEAALPVATKNSGSMSRTGSPSQLGVPWKFSFRI